MTSVTETTGETLNTSNLISNQIEKPNPDVNNTASFVTQGFETSQYAQGFFISGARTAPNKEAAELVCREVMSYIELHATT